MCDLTEVWERPVALSGSGPSVFGWFADEAEAAAAIAEVSGEARSARATGLWSAGVARLD